MQECDIGWNLFNKLEIVFRNRETKHLFDRVAVQTNNESIQFGIVIEYSGYDLWRVQYDEGDVGPTVINTAMVKIANRFYFSLQTMYEHMM